MNRQISPYYIPPDPYPAAGFITDGRIRRKFQSPLRLTRPPDRKVSSIPSVLINPSNRSSPSCSPPPLFSKPFSSSIPSISSLDYYSSCADAQLIKTHTLPSLRERFIESIDAGVVDLTYATTVAVLPNPLVVWQRKYRRYSIPIVDPQ